MFLVLGIGYLFRFCVNITKCTLYDCSNCFTNVIFCRVLQWPTAKSTKTMSTSVSVILWERTSRTFWTGCLTTVLRPLSIVSFMQRNGQDLLQILFRYMVFCCTSFIQIEMLLRLILLTAQSWVVWIYVLSIFSLQMLWLWRRPKAWHCRMFWPRSTNMSIEVCILSVVEYEN